MIDGLENSVCETEVLPLAEPTGSDVNWAGNGFYSTKRIFKSGAEAVRRADQSRGRMWSIVNENKRHYSSGQPIGYKAGPEAGRFQLDLL